MQDSSKSGFTLIELMVAMAIASIVMAAMVSAYQIQVRSKNTQEALTDMNQTARAAAAIMTQEIRSAGCDPTGGANAGIITAESGELIFSADIDDDGGSGQSDGDLCDGNEVIRFYLSNDGDGDGINDNVASGVECNLQRETGAGNDPGAPCGGAGTNAQPLVRNMDALNFVYLDEDGDPIAAPVADTNDIRSIQLTLVVRAGQSSGGFLYSYTNPGDPYPNQLASGDAEYWEFDPPKDSFRRLRLTTTINCRNMGR